VILGLSELFDPIKSIVKSIAARTCTKFIESYTRNSWVLKQIMEE